MNLIKKFFTAFFLAFLILNLSNVTFAIPEEFSAEGEYRVGENDTRATAKKGALDDAKRKIIENIGVHVESYSEANHFKLTMDQIKTAASSMLRITYQEVKFYEDGTLCKAFITAEVDTDIVISSLRVRSNNSYDTGNSQSDTLLRIAGFKEYMGHYYKLFDQGLTWLQAKARCEEMGGHLVTITSEEEQSIVQSLITSEGKKNNYWLGASRELPSESEWLKCIVPDKFKWVTNEPFTYSNWDKNQPDHMSGIENAMMIWKKSGLWNDIVQSGGDSGKDYGSKNFGFICEWESANDIKI